MRSSLIVTIVLFVALPAAIVSCTSGTDKAPGTNQSTTSEVRPGVIRMETYRLYERPLFKDGEWMRGEGLPSEERYEYDEQGRKIAMYRDQYEGEKLSHIKHVFLYKNGKFAGREVWSDSVKSPGSTQWETDSTYREISFNDKGEVDHEYWYLINQTGKPLITKYYASDGLLFFTETHKYDAAGNTTEQTMTFEGSGTSRSTYQVLSKDSFGHPLKTLETTTADDGKVSRNLEVRSYEYF